MGKHYSDPVVDFLKELEIRPARTNSRLYSSLDEAAGKEWTETILRAMEARYDGKSLDIEGEKSFYDIKNSNAAGSIALTGAIDGDILRQFCYWILDHKDCFGQSILEIGCDVGILSCFLARTFPDSSIVSIDRCASSIEIAKTLAKRFGLTNITFMACDVNDMTDLYDTVFSARTMHENFAVDYIDRLSFITTQGQVYEEALVPYAEKMASLVKPDGHFVSIERIERNPLLLGWMWALNGQKFVQQEEYYKDIRCQELRGEMEETHFQAMVYKHGDEQPKEEVYGQFCQTFLEDMDLSAPSYKDWEAAVMLENSVGELIEGYEVYHPKDHNWKFGHYSAWTSKYDDEAMLMYIH